MWVIIRWEPLKKIKFRGPYPEGTLNTGSQKRRFLLQKITNCVLLVFKAVWAFLPPDGCHGSSTRLLSVKTDSRQRLMWHRNMSQHSSQAVASDCCAQHSYDNTLGQVLKITFYGQSALTPESFHARSAHSLKARCSWIRTPWSYPGTSTRPPRPQPTPPPRANQHVPEPCNRWLRGSAGVSWEQEGGLVKVRPGRRGVWDCCDMACLSVSMQVDEEHVARNPPRPPSSPPSTLRSQGFDCRSRSLDGGIQGSSRTNP